MKQKKKKKKLIRLGSFRSLIESFTSGAQKSNEFVFVYVVAAFFLFGRAEIFERLLEPLQVYAVRRTMVQIQFHEIDKGEIVFHLVIKIVLVIFDVYN